jgi:hypothetical protein
MGSIPQRPQLFNVTEVQDRTLGAVTVYWDYNFQSQFTWKVPNAQPNFSAGGNYDHGQHIFKNPRKEFPILVG